MVASIDILNIIFLFLRILTRELMSEFHDKDGLFFYLCLLGFLEI
jgi:hypothetical protein